MGVAQLVEPRLVVPVVAGSSPVIHPKEGRAQSSLLELPRPTQGLKRTVRTPHRGGFRLSRLVSFSGKLGPRPFSLPHLLKPPLLRLPPLPSSVNSTAARHPPLTDMGADIQLALPVFIDDDFVNECLVADPPIRIIVKRPYSDRPLPPSPTL